PSPGPSPTRGEGWGRGELRALPQLSQYQAKRSTLPWWEGRKSRTCSTVRDFRGGGSRGRARSCPLPRGVRGLAGGVEGGGEERGDAAAGRLPGVEGLGV